ncbi:MAG: hypothetical protein F2808_07275 [Actinobacteria bacterium]|nr:hypothetical protein [Actinomycetota bacterium]
MMATNYSIGKPAAVVEYAAIGGAYGICQSFDEGQSAWMQASWLRADMKRNKDSSDNKEFVLTLTDSQAPIVAQTCVPRYFDDWTN